MSDETTTLQMEAAPSIVLGDTISMWETPRLPWWGRLAVRLGLRAKPEPELRQFQVTASATSATGFFDTLTPEQRTAARAASVDDINFGDPSFRR